jgi:hypothetical protein
MGGSQKSSGLRRIVNPDPTVWCKITLKCTDMVWSLRERGRIRGKWDCNRKNIIETGALHQGSQKLSVTENNFLFLIPQKKRFLKK